MSVTATTEPNTGIIHTFGITPGLLAGQLFNFLVVLFILQRFIFKPLLGKLNQRAEQIARSVEQAKALELRVLQAEKERTDLLAKARNEAQELATIAQNEAVKRREELVFAAKQEVEKVIATGKVQLEQERQQFLISARKDLVDIAIKAAGKILNDSVDPKKSQSLAEEMVRKLT